MGPTRHVKMIVKPLRTIVYSTVTVGALLISATSASAACSPLATSKISSDKPSYSQGDKFDVTYYYETDGGCTDADKPHVKITFNNQSGSLITVGETDCPKHDSGDGMFCELIGGKTFQFRVRGKFDFPGTAQKGVFEGWAYSGSDLKNKTYPPLEVGYAGSNAVGLAPTAAAKDPEPVEATLAVRIGGLTQTSNIGLYLATAFNWGIPVVAILAVTMIAWGGIKWLTAGGDSGRVTSARTTISNAVVGLILAMATYLILSTVNPALTTFKSIEVPKVPRILAPMNTFCEDLLAGYADYRVDPPSGRCGTVAKVSSVNPNTTVLRDTCVFKNCPEDEGVCSKHMTASGKISYGCARCTDMTTEKLSVRTNSDIRLLNDASCRTYSPERSPDKFPLDQCVFTNEADIPGAPKCVRLVVDVCNEIKQCEDYDKHIFLLIEQGFKARGIPARKERNCLGNLSLLGSTMVGDTVTPVGPGACTPIPARHFEAACNADPCNVGPCVAKEIKETEGWKTIIGTIGQALGAGRFWMCVKK